MPKYTMIVRETVRVSIEVDAGSVAEARDKALDYYDNENPTPSDPEYSGYTLFDESGNVADEGGE